METNYFSHCWGVFEGGGVRGAAHSGAYQAAKELGIQFERLAGTSAGSIVASLIAAGGSPDYISDILMKTDLGSLLSPPVKGDTIYKSDNKFIKATILLPFKKLKPYKDILRYSGMHSSYKIQDWVEEKLLELVKPYRQPGMVGNVLFNELKIPLHIVATNLSTGLPQVWSTETTPEESVAYAVRCSCSIPFFFQAIANKNSILVDGGVVSNLPSFVFSKLLNDLHSYTKRPNIINFRLVQNLSELEKTNNIVDYLKKISNAIVSGGTEVQKSLQTSTYNIIIKTGDIGSTDFHKMTDESKNKLHDAGKKAVHEFIENERALYKEGNANAVSKGFDEKMLLLIQQFREHDEEVLISSESCSWLDFLFPTIFEAMRRGTKITCLTLEKNRIDDERFHHLLKNVGIKVVFLGELPFNGFIFSPFSEHCRAVLTTNKNSSDRYKDEKVKVYSFYSDAPIIDLLKEKIESEWSYNNSSIGKLNYTNCSDIELTSKLRNVWQYKNATFILDKVAVNDNIFTMSESVKEYKVSQIKSILNQLSSLGKDIMEVHQVTLLDGSTSIITPPVLEKIGERYFIIDGNARLFYYFNKGIPFIKAVVVENVSQGLPSQHLNPISKVRLTSLTRTLSQNYVGLDESKFRRIEEAVHPFSSEKKK